MDIVAHRGLHDSLPENSLAAFEAALDAGADAIEFDVRITRDSVPIVTHWLECETFLDGVTGYVFEHDLADLAAADLRGSPPGAPLRMPTLEDVLEGFAGRIGLEIELKDPSRGLVGGVARALLRHRKHWDSMEVTSFEPALLAALTNSLPRRIATCVLTRRPEPWMTGPIRAYLGVGAARLAGARAIHQHAAGLDRETVRAVRAAGFDVHGWDVNDDATLGLMSALGIARCDTDDPVRMLALRGQKRVRT